MADREAVLYDFLLLPDGLSRARVRGLPCAALLMEPVVQSDTNDDGVLVSARLASASRQAAGLGVEASSAHAGPPSCGAHAPGSPSCMLPRREMPLPPRPMTQHTNQWTGRERLLRWQLSGKHSRSTSTSSSSTIVLNEVKLYLASECVCAARARTRRPSSLLSNHMYAETTSSAGSRVQSTTRECAGSSERLR